MGVKWPLLLLALPSLAPARPGVEKLGELGVDFSAGTIDVRGVGAADLHAPSAEIARVKAERTARAVAALRLRRWLASLPPPRLGCADATGLQVDEAIARAKPRAIDWGSTGSVVLDLRVALVDLATPPRPPDARATPPTEPPSATVILIDPQAAPQLFAGPACAGVAPAVFDTLAELRAAAIPAASGAAITRIKNPADHVVAIVRSER